MIIKLQSIISCSSEHPSYPAKNLLEYQANKSWRCAKPGEMMSYVIFQLCEPSCLTGLDIGNYRSCIVIVEASTSAEPDNWIPIVNHQFMTHDDAANSRFKDQVQLFTKKELNPETLKLKFDRIKVTCMQAANLRELFGLSFVIFRTEVTVDLDVNVFGRFKLKDTKDNSKLTLNAFREKYMKLHSSKQSNYKQELEETIKGNAMNNFIKRQDKPRESMKRPLLAKEEDGNNDEVFRKDRNFQQSNDKMEGNQSKLFTPEQRASSSYSRKRSLSPVPTTSNESVSTKKMHCSTDSSDALDKICKTCDGLISEKLVKGIVKEHTLQEAENKTVRKTLEEAQAINQENKKPMQVNPHKANAIVEQANSSNQVKKKPKTPLKQKLDFSKLMEGVKFSLSGYVNPQRDEIRKKALKMGATYIAEPNLTNKKCTHLICAFKNTPKYRQFRKHTKIVKVTWIEDCFDKRTRFPWRRYALDEEEAKKPESEEEIEGNMSPVRFGQNRNQNSDSESDY
ncbi:DNA repair protein XRCC1 [Cephus cinctus]|uniref:DNA repair protein XRCC1 n=1 Tax=Cephus cinctus TaxID=211228 RepID=A0AAJ7FNS3_CEPCN|nr:DNA repair protein XRCC1 [Cephus cinctus]